MRFWLLTVGEPIPVADPGNPRLLRTGVLARLLRSRGHEVVWWTSAFDHNAKTHRAPEDTTFNWEGVEVRMLHSVGYSRNVSFRRFREHSEVAKKFAESSPPLPRPDVILASLPTIELAAEAVAFGRARKIPVLVDIRDLWPDVIIDAVPASARWLARLALHRLINSTRKLLRDASGIVGISDAYLDWALKIADRKRQPGDAMFPLGYVAPQPSANAAAAGDKLRALGLCADRALCWYVGSFGQQYDLGPVIEAARDFQQRGRTDVQFVLSGTGELGEKWRAQAAGLDNLLFTGWIDADEINWLRARADIGLQPYVEGALQGLANKLFEYLSAGIPVVSSLRGENATLISREDCGLSYEPGNATDCSDKIAVLLDNPARRRAMGENGRKLFSGQFDGKVVFEGLAAHLESFGSR